MSFTMIAPAGRIDWQAERDRIDLAQVATDLMGPPPGRGRERGLWWRCPFHGDANPSLRVDPAQGKWKCYGCGEHGDAAALVMRLEGKSFREAVAALTGGTTGPSTHRPTPKPRPPDPPQGPKGLSEANALALVGEAEARLWTPEGRDALAYLKDERHLTESTIRQARLGWTPGARLPKASGGWWTARGWTIPWFDPSGRLALVNIRQPEGSTPKYAQAYRNAPTIFAGTPGGARPGLPLVVVEGEFDCLLLGQELDGLAVVLSLGSAMNHPDPAILDRLGRYRPWHAAHDADDAGDKAALAWPARSRRVRPPGASKDWSAARQGGVDLRRWWSDRLKGDESPDLFTWSDLSARRWGPALGDAEPGIIIDRPDPERRRLALAATPTWLADPTDPEAWPEGRE